VENTVENSGCDSKRIGVINLKIPLNAISQYF
jgi:hypothetical protein